MINKIILALCFLSIQGYGQVKTELDIDVASDTAMPLHGPNLGYYQHWYGGLDFLIPGEQNQVSMYGRSHGWMIGFRLIKKVAGVFSAGFEIGYRNRLFFFKDYLPDSITGIRNPRFENIQRRGLEGGFFLRFRSSNKGMAIGNYLDLGVCGDYAYQVRYRLRFDGPSSGLLSGRRSTFEIRKPDWMEPFGAHCMIRLGFNKFSLIAMYSISVPVKSGLQTWSPYTAGIQFAF